MSDSPPGASSEHTRTRRNLAIVLMVGAVVVILAAVIAGWMRTQLLDTDVWVETSRESLQEPAVRETLSRYAVDQLFTYAQPEQLLSDAAPSRLRPLVAPATGALREGAYEAADRALQSEQLNDVWAEANRIAHERVVTVVDGDGEIVRDTSEGIRIDVRPILVAIAQRLGLSGERLERIPDSVSLIEPPRSAAMERSLETLRRLDRAAPILAVLAAALLVGAVVVAPPGERRRMVIVWGLSTAIAGVVLGLLRAGVEPPIVAALTDQPSRSAAIEAVYDNVTELLRLASNAMVLIGAAALIGAWYVGQSRSAVAARDLTVPGLRRYPIATWVGFAVVLLIAFTQVPALESRQPLGLLLIVGLLVVGFAMVHREALRLVPAETPEGSARRALGTLRAKVVPTTGPTGPTTLDMVDRLERLDDLHRRGVLDDDEFEGAKRRLLGRAPAPKSAWTDMGDPGDGAES